MKVLWKVIGVSISIIPLIIIAIISNITFDDLASIDIRQFFLASIFAILRLVILGIRFHYYIRMFIGNVANIIKAIEVRIGSEFVTLITPSYTGGEFIRLAWLNKQNINTGKGAWIITIEVISDVLIGGILSYIAAIYAFLTQNYLIGISIIIVITPILFTYLLLLILSSKRIIQLPSFVNILLAKIIGLEKSNSLINNTNNTLKTLCITSKEHLRYTSLKTFVIGFMLTLLSFIFYAFTIITIIKGIGFFESLLTIVAAQTIGVIPITPGGSGLTELGMGYYLIVFGLDPLQFGDEIIVWRIATYHILLIVSWSILMHITLRK